MEYKIVVDSSSNLTNDYLKDENIGFEVVPLHIYVDGKEYCDNDSIDVYDMIEKVTLSKKKSTTSCPSPEEYLNTFNNANKIIVFTISSKLSGSYNSAVLASNIAKENNKDVFVLDSKGTAGSLQNLVIKAIELIKSNESFEKIKKLLEKERDESNLLFVLNKYDNLVKAGRINKVLAFIASKIAIKPLCIAENGEIKIKEKIRTLEGVFKRLVVNIGKIIQNTKNRICIISYTIEPKWALYLKNEISSKYEFKEVIVEENRGLNSFYALKGGIIVTF